MEGLAHEFVQEDTAVLVDIEEEFARKCQEHEDPSIGQQVSCAIFGGVVGLAIAGPLGLLALGGAGAYATTRQTEGGKLARTVGELGVEVCNKWDAINQEYKFTSCAKQNLTLCVEQVTEKVENVDVPQR